MARCISLSIPCVEKTATTSVQAPAFSYKIFNSVAAIDAASWDSVLPESHTLLHRSYLKALEESGGDEMGYRYLVIERNRNPVGVGFFQIVTFKGSNVANPPPGADASRITKILASLKSVLVKMISGVRADLLVSGNTFITGEYGFYFSPEMKSNDELLKAVTEGIDTIVAQSSQKISGFLVKDFYQNKKDWTEGLKANGYLEFSVNPNMLLDIRPSWNTFDDYLGDMASKYRTRMKKAQKRAAGVTIREMDADEMQQRLPEMSALYDEVVDEADFKLLKLDISHIVKMKHELGGRFGVIGFFKDDALVTFISYFLHKETLVAGYMGLKHAVNQEYDLYLNVLLKLAETGIAKNMKQVVYGRTAMEIKSSVGAVPQPMRLYLKHRSPAINFMMRRVVPFLSKNPEWTLRSPFKESSSLPE